MAAAGEAVAHRYVAGRDERRSAAYAEFFAPVTAGFAVRLAELVGPGDRAALDLGCGAGELAAGARSEVAAVPGTPQWMDEPERTRGRPQGG